MNVNDHLSLLRAVPVHPGLERLDGAMLARRAARDRRESRIVAGFAMIAALGIGVIGGLAPVASEDGGVGVPFGPPVALTPLIALGHG